jgi:hypothetical protein
MIKQWNPLIVGNVKVAHQTYLREPTEDLLNIHEDSITNEHP